MLSPVDGMSGLNDERERDANDVEVSTSHRPWYDHPKTQRWAFIAAFGVLVIIQFVICFQGLGDQWVRGHNGFNGSAYHQSARNTLRWDTLFPVQYYT